jgi:hypothetical protein
MIQLIPCSNDCEHLALPVDELMAPNLAAAQHAQIRDMITHGGFKDSEVAQAVKRSRNAINDIRANLQSSGSTTAPATLADPVGKKWFPISVIFILGDHAYFLGLEVP